MLQREHSAILSTFIKLPSVIKIFILSSFEWLFYTGFTVFVLPIGSGVLVLMLVRSGDVVPSMVNSGYSTIWSLSNMPS